MKLPPVIVRPEEFVKNDMYWLPIIAARSSKGNLKKLE